jgi:peroxiredoxin
MDWNNPYSCKEWAKNFNLTYPILDDSEGDKIYNYFGNGVVPYNIVIDRNGQLVYSASGFNKNEIVSAIKKGLKQSKKENPLLKETQLKQQNKTRYMQLRENKGFD